MADQLESQRPDPLFALMLAVGELVQDQLFAMLEFRDFEGLRSSWDVFANISLEGSRLSEITRRLGHTNQAVGEHVAKLESLGYVERLPDPRDGRAKLITPTKKGRLAKQLAFQTLDRVEADWGRDYGTTQVATLRATLEQIYGAWRQEATEAMGLGQHGLRI